MLKCFSIFCCGGDSNIGSEEYNDFHDKIKNTWPEIRNNLDVVQQIQRMRMHGYAMSMLLNKNQI